MKTDGKVVHSTFMPGEVASEVCGNAGCGEMVTENLGLVTCAGCLTKIEALAHDAATPPVRDFGWALRLLKQGKCVARQGWNGKGMYLWLLPAATVKAEWCREPWLKSLAEQNGGVIEALGSIRMMTADGKVLTGWLASQSDMLADDWVEVS